MPALPSYFSSFLQEVRPTQNQRDECRTGHETLRDRLHNYESLKDIVVGTFLQGSYRRATAIRPIGDSRSDVDVIVVTNLDKSQHTPKQAMKLFEPFLDKYYKGRWQPKGRAFSISLSYVELDLVITAAPSEVQLQSWQEMAQLNESDVLGDTSWKPRDSWLPQESFHGLGEQKATWKLEPLDIPDREANEWDRTHPLAQISAAWAKNRSTNKHYVNVVKAIKWWKCARQSDLEYPKGYPLEHLLWVCCPDNIVSVAQGVVLALEEMSYRYKAYADAGQVPFVPDHGVPEHNVLGRLSPEDFCEFHKRIQSAATQARDAFDENNVCEGADKWRLLFGSKFPECPERTNKGGYTLKKEAGIIPGGRFAL